MIDLRQLETFCVLAQTRNFTRAADALGYSQSNITTRIKKLEQELGAVLFKRHRFSRKVTLTKKGQALLQYALRLFALVDEMKTATQKRRTDLVSNNKAIRF